MVVDMQRRRSFGGISKLHFSMAAPWQECRIVLATINQIEHAFGGLLYQDGFFNKGHSASAISVSCRMAILMERPAA